METPQELAQRWRKRATTMEGVGDGPAKLVAYHLRFCADELDSITPRCTCPASTLFSGNVGRDCPAHTWT